MRHLGSDLVTEANECHGGGTAAKRTRVLTESEALAQDGRCTTQARNEGGTRELDQAKLDAIRL